MIEAGSSLATNLGTLSMLDSIPGQDSGTCYVCGRVTEHGWAEAPSDNFPAWSQIYRGSVMCDQCRPVFKDRRFRQRSWLASPRGVEFADKERPTLLWDALLDPPEPPWTCYITGLAASHCSTSAAVKPASSHAFAVEVTLPPCAQSPAVRRVEPMARMLSVSSMSSASI